MFRRTSFATTPVSSCFGAEGRGKFYETSAACATSCSTTRSAWAVVDPVPAAHPRALAYARSAKEADALIAADGAWHNPLPEPAAA